MGKDKPCPVLIILIDPDIASHTLYGQFADRQSQTCSLHKFVELLKTLEYQFLFVLGNSRACIGHGKQHTLVFLIYFIIQRNASAGRSKLQCVVQQVGNDLLQA